MESLQKRRLLFLFGCIGARLMLSRVLYTMDPRFNRYLIGLCICMIGIGFWYIYWFNLRKTGVEVFGDVIWWNDMRPFHGTMYLVAGVAFLSKEYKEYAWRLVCLDAMVGLVKFLEHHFTL